MIVSPEVIVEAAGPLGDAPSRPIKAFYNLCGYDPSEESPILLSWIGDFFLSGGLPKMATCSESKQFTVCSQAAIILFVTCIGELLHYFLPLPIPASIYGLLLMFGLLYFHVVKLESVEAVGDLLVEIMPVMFIPAGVGLVVSWTELQAILVPVCVITAVVTLIVMVVTGKVSDALLSKKPGEVKDEVLECADKVRQQARTAMSTAADVTAVNTREA